MFIASVKLLLLLSLLPSLQVSEAPIRCAIGLFDFAKTGQCDAGVCYHYFASFNARKVGCGINAEICNGECEYCNTSNFCNINSTVIFENNDYSFKKTDEKLNCLHGKLFKPGGTICKPGFCHWYKDLNFPNWFQVGCGHCPTHFINTCFVCNSGDNCHLTEAVQQKKSPMHPDAHSPARSPTAKGIRCPKSILNTELIFECEFGFCFQEFTEGYTQFEPEFVIGCGVYKSPSISYCNDTDFCHMDLLPPGQNRFSFNKSSVNVKCIHGVFRVSDCRSEFCSRFQSDDHPTKLHYECGKCEPNRRNCMECTGEDACNIKRFKPSVGQFLKSTDHKSSQIKSLPESTESSKLPESTESPKLPESTESPAVESQIVTKTSTAENANVFSPSPKLPKKSHADATIRCAIGMFDWDKTAECENAFCYNVFGDYKFPNVGCGHFNGPKFGSKVAYCNGSNFCNINWLIPEINSSETDEKLNCLHGKLFKPGGTICKAGFCHWYKDLNFPNWFQLGCGSCPSYIKNDECFNCTSEDNCHLTEALKHKNDREDATEDAVSELRSDNAKIRCSVGFVDLQQSDLLCRAGICYRDFAIFEAEYQPFFTLGCSHRNTYSAAHCNTTDNCNLKSMKIGENFLTFNNNESFVTEIKCVTGYFSSEFCSADLCYRHLSQSYFHLGCGECETSSDCITCDTEDNCNLNGIF